jgi:hypothetical protein
MRLSVRHNRAVDSRSSARTVACDCGSARSLSTRNAGSEVMANKAAVISIVTGT